MLRKTGNAYLSTHFLALLALSALLPGVLPAQSSPVRAYLDKTRLRLGERFVLSVEISGEAARDYEKPSLPEMSDFARFQGSGNSQQVQIINGRVSSSHKIDFYFTATREGDFEIGPVQVESRGRTYTTSPLDLSIGPSPTADPSAQTRPRDRDLFVVATANQTTAFQNEAVVITYKIYTRLSVSSLSVGRLPETAGFWVENYTLPESPSTLTEIINGRRYTVATIRKMAVFPTTAGKKEIGPMQIECTVRVQRRTRSLFDDFFSRDLFGSNEPLSLESNPVKLEILPLPEENRPPGFDGAVGQFSISARIKTEASRANQAFALRVKIEGEGNIQHLAEPKFKLPESFEVYPPEIEQEVRYGALGLSGQKTYEYVAIPRRAGSFPLEPLEISYFDPRDLTYKTARSEPLTLEIAPGNDSLSVDTASLTKRELELVGQDIRFIKTSSRDLSRRSSQPASGFWSLLMVPLAALAGAGVLRQHRLRLHSDVAWARARRAAGAARKRLSRARRSLQGDSVEFYGELDRALAGFIGDKLNLPDPSLVSHEIQQLLLAAGVSAELVDEALACRNMCDRNRFSPHSTSLQEKEECLGRVERCLTALGSRLRRRGG